MDDKFGSLTSGTLLHLYEHPFLILIPSVFLAMDSSKTRPSPVLHVDIDLIIKETILLFLFSDVAFERVKIHSFIYLKN